ncbi:MAG TPA: zinc-binding dehydrogenase [Gemmatimonadales bacterium]|jgi:NADPH:quinone reductase-like Zn-dependent oxidoreductase
MKALVLTGIGGLDHVAVADIPEPPPPGPGEALVGIHSAALNRLDLFIAEGLKGITLELPHVIGSDGAGIVEQVGSDVSTVRPGDRVMIHPGISCGRCPACTSGEDSLCSSFCVVGEHRSGTAAEYIVLPAQNLAPVPPAMPWDRAAAFSLATLTAWRMLTTRARLIAGETVLIWGIGGGVAMAALQVAVLLGARAIVTSGSDDKLAVAAREGATATINHSAADVPAEVKRLTGGLGADVVVDSVGEQTWQKSQRSLRRGGRLVVCGATSGPHVSIDLRRLFWHQWNLLGSTLGNRREYAEIVRLVHEGKLWPVVDRSVPLADGRSAVERLHRGEQTGKLVIEVAS